jgi:hypothetical protein
VTGTEVEVMDNHMEALKLFNEKADKLLKSAFVEALASGQTEATISGHRQENGSFEISSKLRGPSPEAVEAFVLTFRFFIQDNETTSLRNIATIYEEIGDDDGFLSRFNSARNAINQFLDSPNYVNVTFHNQTPTNRDVMETFIYGGLAHANPEKHQWFKAWMGFPLANVLFSLCFSSVLGQVLRAISFIQNLNEELIPKLESS